MLPASGEEMVREGDHFRAGYFGRKVPAHAPALSACDGYRPK